MTKQQLDEASVSLLAQTPYTLKTVTFDEEAGVRHDEETLEAVLEQQQRQGSRWRISYTKNGKRLSESLYMHNSTFSEELQMRWMILDIMRDFKRQESLNV